MKKKIKIIRETISWNRARIIKGVAAEVIDISYNRYEEESVSLSKISVQNTNMQAQTPLAWHFHTTLAKLTVLSTEEIHTSVGD